MRHCSLVTLFVLMAFAMPPFTVSASYFNYHDDQLPQPPVEVHDIDVRNVPQVGEVIVIVGADGNVYQYREQYQDWIKVLAHGHTTRFTKVSIDAGERAGENISYWLIGSGRLFRYDTATQRVSTIACPAEPVVDIEFSGYGLDNAWGVAASIDKSCWATKDGQVWEQIPGCTGSRVAHLTSVEDQGVLNIAQIFVAREYGQDTKIDYYFFDDWDMSPCALVDVTPSKIASIRPLFFEIPKKACGLGLMTIHENGIATSKMNPLEPHVWHQISAPEPIHAQAGVDADRIYIVNKNGELKFSYFVYSNRIVTPKEEISRRFEWRHFGPFLTSCGGGRLRVVMTGTMDPDLYIKQGARPTASDWDYRPYIGGANEAVELKKWGTFYVSVRSYSSFCSFQLDINWESDDMEYRGD